MGERGEERLLNRDVVLVMAATFCFMASNMLVSPLMAGFSESLGAGGALMGLVTAAMNFVSLFCRPIAGNLSDRISKRAIVSFGSALYLVSSVWYALASDPAKPATAILLPDFAKADLFKGVVLGGVLPRKTFSMGHAEEKRYYNECRVIGV